MLLIILTVLMIFALLVGSELWWRTKHPHDEFSRKFIHITVGSLAALFPFYLSWRAIIFLSVSFVIIVLVSKYLHVFQAIHAVERPTWGEIFFALAVGALVYITHDKWVYAAALLHMSLADGMAAIVGVTWGQPARYRVLGHIKTIAGSSAFLVVSLAILLTYSELAHPLSPLVILGLAGSAMVIENFGIAGTDNLLVPVLVGVVLSQLA